MAASALVVGWVGTALPATAQTSAPVPAANGAASAKPGFLWDARKGERRVTLVGTIHFGRIDFATLAPDIAARMSSAAVLAVEADPSQAAKAAALLQQYALLAPGEPALGERLDPKLRARLDALVVRYNLVPQVVQRMKPWFVALNLVASEFTLRGLSPAHGTETVLLTAAQRDGRKVVELEGIEAQFRLFDAAPAAVQMAYLEQTIRSIESGAAEAEVRRIVDAWAARDFAAGERLMSTLQASAAKGPAERFVVEQLFDGRHPRMLDEIERLASSSAPPLVAVGALHYFGPNGLVAGLRNRGWTVTEVR